MKNLIIGKTNVTELLTKKYKKIGIGWVTLITLPAEKHIDINSEALKILVNEMNFGCIYITLVKTFDELDKLFKSKGVKTDNLYYIDAISNMYGVKETSTNRCIYSTGPIDLLSLMYLFTFITLIIWSLLSIVV